MSPHPQGAPPGVAGTPVWGGGQSPLAAASATSSLLFRRTSPSTASLAATAASTTSPQAGPPPDTYPPNVPMGDPGTTVQTGANIVIGVTCMLLVLCITAVVGRFCARRMVRVKLEADDWMAVVALVRTPIFYSVENPRGRLLITLVQVFFISFSIQEFLGKYRCLYSVF